jgi:hypothetical protein
MSKRLVGALVAIVTLSSSTRGETCSCMPPVAWVAPGPLDPAPVNAHLFVTFDEHAPFCVGMNCVPTEASIALRAAAHDAVAAKAIAMHVTRKTKMGNFVHQELAPDAPLAPKTRYEVLMLDALGKSPVRVVGTFVTTSAADHVAPEWSAIIEEAELRHPSGMIDCGEGDSLVMRVPPAKDASTVRWEIYVAPGDATIDWSKQPSGVVFPTEIYGNGNLQLTIGDDPGAPSVPLPKASSVRVGVRPIDVAGNVGKEAEVVRAWPKKKP